MNKPLSLLPQVAFSIMLALSLRSRHGYEIMQQVESDSDGKIKLGPGALYGSIKQLVEQGLIEEVPDEPSSRRRYYRLTEAGRRRLGSELSYYRNVVELASSRHLPGTLETRWA